MNNQNRIQKRFYYLIIFHKILILLNFNAVDHSDLKHWISIVKPVGMEYIHFFKFFIGKLISVTLFSCISFLKKVS